MKCPVCRDPDLAMSTREGIEIDYCPQCRGVWLDRGELDKVIERSSDFGSGPKYRERDEYREKDKYRERDEYRGKHYSDYRQRKPKNMLKELFDF